MTLRDVVVALERESWLWDRSAPYIQDHLLCEYGKFVSVSVIEAARRRIAELYPDCVPHN